MAKKKTPKKMGRPLIKIDVEVFQQLCVIHCTKEEIANFLKVSEDTIENWCKRTYETTFSVVYKKYQGEGKISLRRWQWRAAQRGNTSMLIWLGKQYLGQSNKEQIEHSGSIESIEVEYVNSKAKRNSSSKEESGS